MKTRKAVSELNVWLWVTATGSAQFQTRPVLICHQQFDHFQGLVSQKRLILNFHLQGNFSTDAFSLIKW